MTKVLILGARGMLGSAVVREFSDFDGQVFATVRPGAGVAEIEGVSIREFDAEVDDFSILAYDLGPNDFIINCIGLVKARIDESVPDSVSRAIKLNSTFPNEIQKFVATSGTKVIQIATDCVFSGTKGGYLETDPHDATDVYGKTKSAGEVLSDQFMNIRVSIIGPENSGHTSLYDWVRFQPLGAQINGYTNHFWNGIPAKHFAKACFEIIGKDYFQPGVMHLLPANKVSKYQLVKYIANHLNRNDLQITPFSHPLPIDRSLATNDGDFSSDIWKFLGFDDKPAIQRLVEEIS